MAYSVGVVFGSVQIVNRLLLSEPESLMKHPRFVLCVAFILYFSFSALTESFWVFGLQQSRFFRVEVLVVQNWVNLGNYIPKGREFMR